MNTGSVISHSEGKRSLVSIWYSREPVLASMSLGILALVPFLLLGLAIDERTQHDINIWVKPLKFNVSMFVYFGTLAWFSGWIDRSVMRSLWYRAYVWTLCGSTVVLLSWLYSAALLGELAHFNRTHPVFAPLYSLMGIMSVTLTAGTLVVAGLICINRQSPLNTRFRYAVVLSLLISFIFTVVMAGELASMDSHWIGGTESDKYGLAFMGWSRDGGDLRVAQFFALHAMQVIPVVALAPLPERLSRFPRLLASTVSLLYSGFVIFVYHQAKQGLPFIPWLG